MRKITYFKKVLVSLFADVKNHEGELMELIHALAITTGCKQTASVNGSPLFSGYRQHLMDAPSAMNVSASAIAV